MKRRTKHVDQWVSFDDRRPRLGQVVLVCWEGMRPNPGWLPCVMTWRGFDGEGYPCWEEWCGLRDAGDPQPTHWQPITRPGRRSPWVRHES